MTVAASGKRLLVMAGGTGGHVFPALAVARRLAQQGWQIRWLGTADRMEARLVPQHGFDIDFIDIKGVRGNGLFRKLSAPFKVLHSILQALKVIHEFKPDVVLGMGGFASGPGGVAAKIARIPLVLHEQNAVPGLTNKLLSRIATQVLCAFANTFTKVKAQVVGNPIRAELVALGESPKAVSTEAVKVLVVGGSLGAKVFNELLPETIARVSQSLSVTVWHHAGKGNQAAVQAQYKHWGQDDRVKVADFIDDMEAAYRWADLVICRAGALTVSELATVGLPAIFVPLPHAVDDHQTRNAQVLVDAGAAKLLPQSQLNIESLSAAVLALAEDREQLVQMGQKARTVAVLDATDKVAAVCSALAEKGSK
ncbi:undecaprenyldiphospho-muramoylpentapeptide beta-N-acetylglucosaminyltransferase [Shewanella sp. A32]|uniref:undecaprenyldiphospho-muramoylpentapeptide beta-N-acetylglucosaminyltransferase n=1 Tax=Shewanella sp. A32 TaxID=3031327 RepID=UPI0023BA0C94|nr:undecaprenyldiphospho-muramoylpentapeptide beta-N-acetylglucosaminyltransferase [Shewanella sp. A32]MDF0535549.1 undecaprenyldiphospho-muramoylpentapeptide beta-N-acetylglucosaminyltransferase [Shewanella sp. A32]